MTGSSGIETPVAERRSALLLVRTPFQAWIAERILRAEDVSEYELLYFTQHDAAEDRYYFAHLAEDCALAKYCYAPVRPLDALGYLDFLWQARSFMRDRRKQLTMLASIDDYVFAAIAKRQHEAQLITFDDGTANYFERSIYHIDRPNRRGKLYRRVLGSYDVTEIRRNSLRHYTLHKHFENIVDAARLRGIELDYSSSSTAGGPPVTFFIGDPFSQVFNEDQIARFTRYVEGMNLDFYVQHPREAKPLPLGAKVLEKDGRIAEQAIIEASKGRPIHLVGSFTSVLFNMSDIATRKTMLLPADDIESEGRRRLAVRADIEVALV